MTIVFHRANRVGDNVVAIRAIYAIKSLFPQAKLIVASNAIGVNLYANLTFIDVLLNLESNPNALDSIQCIDYFILTHRTSANIAFAKNTTARKIIVKAHLHSLFSPRFINDYSFFTKTRPESENLMSLVRLIDKRAFDNGAKNLNFSAARLQTTEENKGFVKGFFAQNQCFYDTSRANIGINFFGSGGVCFFSLEVWYEIIRDLAYTFSDCNFIILSPPLHSLESFDMPNIAVFINNADLLNLVAITECLNAFISVDTGNVHIADNLGIPTLGIYTPKMAKRWRGGTYGGKFVQFVMSSSDKECNTLQKERFLDFAKGQIPTLLQNLNYQ